MKTGYSAEELLESYCGISLLNQRILDSLKTVLSALHEKGIEVMLLKGADLLLRFGSLKGFRPMHDVDLLVHEKDFHAMDNMLKAMNYVPQRDGNPVYADPENVYELDITSSIWYLDDPEGVWQRSRKRPIGGACYREMSPEDLIIYLTAYVTVHRGFLSPVYPRDLSLILSHESVDWAVIKERVLKAHLKIPVYYGFQYALRHDVKIPKEVTEAFAPSSAGERRMFFLFQKLVTEIRIPQIGHFLLWLTCPRHKKGSWLANMFFPSRSKMNCRYGSRAGWGGIFLRIQRVFSLICQFITLSFKIVSAVLKRG